MSLFTISSSLNFFFHWISCFTQKYVTLLKKMGSECRFMMMSNFQRKFSLVLTPKSDTRYHTLSKKKKILSSKKKFFFLFLLSGIQYCAFIFHQITGYLLPLLTRSLSAFSLAFCAPFVCLIRNISLVQLVVPISLYILHRSLRLDSLSITAFINRLFPMLTITRVKAD